MRKPALVALATVILTGSAFAQSFYVVQDASTKRCTVVSEKPVGTTTTVVGDGVVYKSKTEAEGSIKTTKVCTSD